jgi:hypothetical protein
MHAANDEHRRDVKSTLYQREDKALREEGVYLCTLLKLTEGVVRFFKAPEAEHLLLTPLGRLGVSGVQEPPSKSKCPPREHDTIDISLHGIPRSIGTKVPVAR